MSVRLSGGGPEMEKWAVLSSTSVKRAKYRYALGRRWAPGPKLALVMLNGSTATHEDEDPTVRRGIGFARSLECGTLEIANLYGLRSMDPRKLWTDSDPVGPENDLWIKNVCTNAKYVIAAWGAHKKAAKRAEYVMNALLPDVEILCLRLTKHGSPEHPLYIPAKQRPFVFRPPLGRAQVRELDHILVKR